MRVLRWLEGQRASLGCHMAVARLEDAFKMWLDYLRMGKEIGLDLAREDVLCPRGLRERHDLAAEEQARVIGERQKKDAEQLRAEQLQKLKRRMKKYDFELDGWIVRCAPSTQDIVYEGKALGHCVAGYATRHLEGALTICFLRRAETPETPYVTMELAGSEIRQAYGQGNRLNAKREHRELLETYTAWLSAGSKRGKDGRPVLPVKEKKGDAA